MTLKAKILKRAAFGFEKLKTPYDMGGDNTDESAVFALGAEQESKRLAPLLEALALCAHALEDIYGSPENKLSFRSTECSGEALSNLERLLSAKSLGDE